MRSFPGLALMIVVLVPLASCTAIGPTVPVTPGAGKAADASAGDRRACMAAIDRELQPVANRLNAPGTSPDQVVANNQRIQEASDRSYVDCMAARGNIPPPGAVPIATATSQYSPTLADTVMTAFVPGNLQQGWRLLGLSYHAASGRPVDANDALWQREIAKLPGGPDGALPVYSVSLDDGPRTVLLSIAGQLDGICDNGANSAASTRDYAVCPGKMAVIEGGWLLSVRQVGLLCAEAINAGGVQPGAPGWQNPTRWGTRARHDAAARTVELVTLQDGRAQPGCGKRLVIR